MMCLISIKKDSYNHNYPLTTLDWDFFIFHRRPKAEASFIELGFPPTLIVYTKFIELFYNHAELNI